MTNDAIVTYVYYNYDILKLVRKLISNAKRDGTDGELSQYIYMTLLTMDNKKLYKMFKDETLKSFIAKIIINQRNTGRYYNKYIKNKHIEYIDEIGDFIDEDIFDLSADFLFDELEKYNWFITGATQDELRKMTGYEVFHLYICGMSKLKIMLQFSISLSTLNNLIRESKDNLKIVYEKNYDTYAEKINNRLCLEQ